MALETQKGFPCFEKPIINRTMGTVTVETVLGHIRMFIQEWPPLLSMTLDTGLFDTVLEQIVFQSPVGIVAVNTENPPFPEGMMAWQGKLRPGSLVTAETKLARGDGGYC